MERISLDKDYIENLVFRLNYGQNAPRRIGCELTDSCFKFSPEVISPLLKSFLSILAKKKGIERNLLVKRFIEKKYFILKINISLYYSENLKNFLAEKSPVPLARRGALARSADEKNIISSKNSQFEMNNLAAGLGFEPRIFASRARRATAAPPRNFN